MVKIILFVKRNKHFFFLDLNGKRRRENKGGGVTDSRLDVRKRGGGHSDAYCVQQGGGGGLKFREKCVCN